MAGKRRSEEERRIIFNAGISGESVYEVNSRLISKGYRAVPYGSYHMVCHRYVPAFKKNPSLLSKCIAHPVPVKDLPK